MARQLKARKPDEGLVTKPQVLIFGPPGVGKTWGALDFPRTYFIDTEGGASLPQYQRKLAAAGGAYFGKDDGSADFRNVIAEVQALATTKHDYLTLVIDSFSKLYLLEAARAEAQVGNAYAADRKEANKPTRQLMLWLERLDMNVLLICHEKEKWKREGNTLANQGQTFDGFEKLEYDLHLCLHVTRAGARVHKTRLEGFPREATFPWSFAEFEKRAGSTLMLRPPKVAEMAAAEQVKEIEHLTQTLKLEDGLLDKWFAKAKADDWTDFTRADLQKCIDYCTSLVKNGGQAA